MKRNLNYAEMTDLELAADLERWASVRDRINLRRRHGEGYGVTLGSDNLLEAAKRLQGDHKHIDGLEEVNDIDLYQQIQGCPTCQTLKREIEEQHEDAQRERYNSELAEHDW